MVFGKKKETTEQRKNRLEKELIAIQGRLETETKKEATDLKKETASLDSPTPVQEMRNEQKGNGEAVKSLMEDLQKKYGGVFPELGPSDHAHVLRMLLLGVIGELQELRKELAKR